MAKKKSQKNDFETLNKPVPQWVAVVVLIALFLASIKIVQAALGVY